MKGSAGQPALARGIFILAVFCVSTIGVGAQPANKAYLKGGCDTPQTPFCDAPGGTMIPPTGTDPAPWFQNIPSVTPFDQGRQSTDYPLQISVGIANFNANNGASPTSTAEQRRIQLRNIETKDERPPRDGGRLH